MALSVKALLLLTAMVGIATVSANSYGAPSQACNSMMPNHGAAAQRGNGGYKVELNACDGYGPAQQFQMRISGTQPFMGFFCRGQYVGTQGHNNAAGYFSRGDLPRFTVTSVCPPSPKQAVTHNRRLTNTRQLDFGWVAPSRLNGSVYLRCTFVRNKLTFYTDVRSVVISPRPRGKVPARCPDVGTQPAAPPGQPGGSQTSSCSCPAGPRGPKGDTGARGERGYNGYAGQTGRKGAPGQKGEPGQVVTRQVTSSGQPGSRGPPGPPGAQGGRGQKGEPGTPGRNGGTGNTGRRGQKGDAGQRGNRGEKGAKGDRGFIGGQGPQGAKGEAGSPGRYGAPGAKGEPGLPGPKGDSSQSSSLQQYMQLRSTVSQLQTQVVGVEQRVARLERRRIVPITTAPPEQPVPFEQTSEYTDIQTSLEKIQRQNRKYMADMRDLREELRLLREQTGITITLPPPPITASPGESIDYCEACKSPLGISNGQIKASQLTASSSIIGMEAHRARLNARTGAWAPADPNGAYVEVDLGELMYITAVRTQGMSSVLQWVTKYSLSYSTTASGNNWTVYPTSCGGNSNAGSTALCQLSCGPRESLLRARRLRLVITEYETYPTLRFELYGCKSTPAPSSG